MAGLVPAIHVFLAAFGEQGVDARGKRGHDGGGVMRAVTMPGCGLIKRTAAGHDAPLVPIESTSKLGRVT